MTNMRTPTHSRRLSDSGFSLLIALGITILIFSPFWGQMLFSDVMTFQKNNDILKLTFPAFCRAWDLTQLNGIDLGSFCGASEMVFRANLPMLYPLFILFSMLGKISSFEAAYLLFYMVQMLGFVYFALRLSMTFFGLDRKKATLFALSALTTVIFAYWYVSFYIAVTLSMPIFYFALKAYRKRTPSAIFMASAPYVLGFCCGYATLAVFVCGFTCLMVLLYAFFWEENTSLAHWKKVWYALLPPALASIVVVTYYVQVLKYMPAGSSSLSVASEWSLASMDLTQLFSFAQSVAFPIEAVNTPYIGMAWLFLLVAFALKGKLKETFSFKRKLFLYAEFGLTALFLLISMCQYTPIHSWFYGLVPVLGAMHLPIRYLLIIMPHFFLSATILLANQETFPSKGTIQITGIVVGALLLFLLFDRADILALDKNRIVLELALLFFFLLVYARNHNSVVTLVAILLCTLLMPLQFHLYYGQEIYAPQSTFEARSIVYSETAQATFDSYLSALPEKELYKFASYDSTDEVPEYIPNNYAWYDYSNYRLSNYSGYELHMAVNRDYLARFPWFGTMDWGYIADTRGDFAVLNPSLVAENPELYQTVIDETCPATALNETNTMYTLKKFIPSYYTGEQFVVDDGNSLDNGFFYSPDLTNADILDFQTNNTSRFSITVQAETATDLGFLISPNPHFVYSVDGVTVEPTLSNGLAYIPVDAGTHTVSVHYENTLHLLSLGVFAVYYVAVTGVAVWSVIKRKRGQNG